MSTSTDTTFVTRLQRILDQILAGQAKREVLYHYTTQGGLLGIIEKREIWATHHQCLNDPQEFVHAKDLFRREVEDRGESDPLLVEMRRALDGPGFEEVNLYLASFSVDGDSLSHWRAYGGPTAGFCLGFEARKIDLPDPFKLVPCIYEEQAQREILKSLVATILDELHEYPREITDAPELVRQYVPAFCRIGLHTLALVFKNPKFADDREWRIVSSDAMMEDPLDEGETPLDFREGKSTLIPYRRVPLGDNRSNFPLTQVIVGPNPNVDQSVRSVRSLLKSHGLASREVLPSKVPYRNW